MQYSYNNEMNLKSQEAQHEFSSLKICKEVTEENMKAMVYQIEMKRNEDEDTMTCEMFFKTDDEKSKVV